MYVAGQCVEAALQATGGNPDNKALIDALRKVSLTDIPRGAIKFDPYGNVIGDVFIRKCERKDGQLVNTVVKTYPNVSQFGQFNKEEFLKTPVYSRDFPPCKFCN